MREKALVIDSQKSSDFIISVMTDRYPELKVDSSY